MILIKNLKKSFHHLDVLKGITATIQKGTVTAILGPSGSGKSTLLRTLNLLEMPTSGQIYIDKEEITKKNYPIEKMRQKVGMVFQHFHLFPHFTTLENLTYAPLNVLKENKTEVTDRALALLERVGLSDKADVYPHALSGGQKQRVAIARALMMQPEVILFDEPTSALDPEMVKEVLDVIKGLAHTNITIVLVTHEMAFARDIADIIWFIDEGVLVEETPPPTILYNPHLCPCPSILRKSSLIWALKRLFL